MKRIPFDAVDGCVGRLMSNVELSLRCPKPEKLKKILTVKNKSAAFKLKKAKESLGFHESKLLGLDHIDTPHTDDLYVNTVAKIEDIKLQIPALEAQVVEHFYIENDDGSFSVPAGFWYLCDRVDGDQHLNKEIPHFKLPGLRPYQSDGLDQLYKYRRGTIELATGLGKSKMIMSVALAAVRAKKRVMIVVPTEYLVGQMYRELKELHANTTAVGGDFKHPKLGWDIMVITMDSAPKYADIATTLIIDEGHHTPAATWFELLSGAGAATHVYNFTATAFRADGMDLAIHAFGGPIVYARDARWGLDNDWLSPLSVIQVRIRPRYSDGRQMGLKDHVPMQAAYKAVMSAPNVTAFIKQKLNVALGKDRRTMCIFKTVKFAEAFKKYCAGEPAFQIAHADKKKSKDPKRPLRLFNEGSTNLLVACDKLVSEGIDIPDSNFMLMATQHTSDITTLQLLGRILRKAEGKTGAVCLDVAVLGYAQFERAAKARLKVYQQLCDHVTEIDL